MKRFTEILLAVKNLAAMVFAGITMLYAVIGYFFGLSSMSFSFIWQAMFIALICGILLFVAFSDYVIKGKSFALRLTLFAVPLYAVVGAFALLFKWFPVNLGNWAVFTLVFAAGFGLLLVGIHIYFRITGNKYNQMLAVYQAKQAE